MTEADRLTEEINQRVWHGLSAVRTCQMCKHWAKFGGGDMGDCLSPRARAGMLESSCVTSKDFGCRYWDKI